MENGVQLLAARPHLSANGGGGGRTSTQMVSARHTSCSHRLRIMNPSSPSRQPVENVCATTSETPIILMPADGKQTPTKSPCTTQTSRQPDFHINKISADPSPMLNSPYEPSPDEPHPLSNSGKTGSNYPLSIAHSMRSPHRYPSYRPNAECPSRKVES